LLDDTNIPFFVHSSQTDASLRIWAVEEACASLQRPIHVGQKWQPPNPDAKSLRRLNGKTIIEYTRSTYAYACAGLGWQLQGTTIQGILLLERETGPTPQGISDY